jgi:hypothetical protein
MMALILCMTSGTTVSPTHSMTVTPHLFSPVYGYTAQSKNYKYNIQLSAWSFTVKTVTPFIHLTLDNKEFGIINAQCNHEDPFIHVYFVVTGVITP